MGNEKHNKEVLESLNPGDMIKFRRGPYFHWGIYYGIRQVIQFTGDKLSRPTVKMESLWRACDGKEAHNGNSKDRNYRPLPVEKILENAESLLDETCDYNFLTNSCEHFASWCRYGKKKSQQSRNLVVSSAQTAAMAAGEAVGGGITAGPLVAVVGGVAGAVGGTAVGVTQGIVSHFQSQ